MFFRPTHIWSEEAFHKKLDKHGFSKCFQCHRIRKNDNLYDDESHFFSEIFKRRYPHFRYLICREHRSFKEIATELLLERDGFMKNIEWINGSKSKEEVNPWLLDNEDTVLFGVAKLAKEKE